ncbi:MAG: PRC and DUF2382 domain-containing protein [Actinomycetota bacterium]|nr:PRC and DUF2382 domain-containing protein [Actinomycetota bacterium]
MTQSKYSDSPNHVKLRDSDRVLEDSEPDILGWAARDEAGNEVGTVSDLLLNTETDYVDALLLEDGEEYPIDDVEIGSGSVLLRRGVGTPIEGKPGRPAAEADELTVQRSEEELRAGVREREAGRIKVRKQVKTEREQVRVPKRREEVAVDRVPVNEPGSESEIGEDDVSVPVVEEEVVVEKRPVVKEEVRIRKDVVADEEVVEEEVRKEEVDIDDGTSSGRRR